MYLNKEVIKPWIICLKGDPIEIITKRHAPQILIRCNGDTLTVHEDDITSELPVKKERRLVPVEKPAELPAKPKQVNLDVKTIKKPIVKQPSFF